MASVEKAETMDNENLNEDGHKKEESSSEKEELSIDETTDVKEPEGHNPIVTGKRQRTAVQAFTSAPPPKEKKELEFEVGNGVLLGDIDIVTEYMDKTVAEHYGILHRILYNVVGTQTMRKKNIRRFNGFGFEKESKEYDSKLAAIRRLKSVDRKTAMKLLGLTQNTTIDDMMEFLMSPTDSNRHAPSKRKSKTPAKRKRSSSKDEDGGAKKSTKKKAAKQTKATPKKKAAAAKKEEELDSDSMSDSESEPEKSPPKKSAQKKTAKQTKATPKKSKPTAAKTPKRKAAAAKKESDDVVDSSLSDSESESEKEKSAPKKRKLSESFTDISQDDNGPSDKDLISAIQKTVEGIDLEEVSMKQAVAKVHEMFPSDDLSSKKSFIKEKIREFIG